MRFLVVNATGRTLHVRLDRNDAGKLVLTVSKNKLLHGRPVADYVMSVTNSLHLPRLDGNDDVSLLNPDGLRVTVGTGTNGERVVRFSLPPYNVN